MQNDHDDVGVIAGEERQVGRQPLREGFVERDAEGPLARQLEQDEGADVDEPDLGGVASRLEHEVTNRHDELGHLGGGGVRWVRWVRFG